MEPVEELVIDVAEEFQGMVIAQVGIRRGTLTRMVNHGSGRVRLDFRIPARGLIGFRSQFLTETRGTGIMHHVFAGWEPWHGPIPRGRPAPWSPIVPGAATAYAIANLQERGEMFIDPGDRRLRRHDCRRELAAKRYGRQHHPRKETDEHARLVRRRSHPSHPAAPSRLGTSDRVHQRRRAGGSDAKEPETAKESPRVESEAEAGDRDRGLKAVRDFVWASSGPWRALVVRGLKGGRRPGLERRSSSGTWSAVVVRAACSIQSGRVVVLHSRHWRQDMGAIGVYAVGAIVFSYPLIARFGSWFPSGPENQDVFLFLWNNWWIHHAILVLHSKPYITDFIYAPFVTDLRFTSSGLLYGVLSMPVFDALGPVAVLNGQVLATTVLNGYATFVLARRLSGRGDAGFFCGLLLAATPALNFHLASGRPSCAALWPAIFMIHFFLRLTDRPGNRAAIGFVVFAVATLAGDQEAALFGVCWLVVLIAHAFATDARARLLAPQFLVWLRYSRPSSPGFLLISCISSRFSQPLATRHQRPRRRFATAFPSPSSGRRG